MAVVLTVNVRWRVCTRQWLVCFIGLRRKYCNRGVLKAEIHAAKTRLQQFKYGSHASLVLK